MRFLVVTFAPLLKDGDRYTSYGPYVREMDLWFNNVDEVGFCCPTKYSAGNLLSAPFKRSDFKVFPVPEFSLFNPLRLIYLPFICFQIFRAMIWADHIHLRCPGNMGVLACVIQILFPWKTKTAKYAGNWDWKSDQPRSYRFQQRLLRNTFLTRRMTTLVYGTWPDRTKNILPFFTATYTEKDKAEVPARSLNDKIRLIFVGALTEGKMPLLSIQVCEKLRAQGLNAILDLYGDGAERKSLENYIREHRLESFVHVHGNQPGYVVREAFMESHFLIFISKSEGWPKVVAESMWWGCIPVTSAVSCVPEMIGYGQRGILVEPNVEIVVESITDLLARPSDYTAMSKAAMDWSRNYTLEKFETEIKKLL